jgi:small-conductance mechanosensitive channel
MKLIPHATPIIGTAIALLCIWIIHAIASRMIERGIHDPRRRYSRRKLVSTALVIGITAVLIVLWAVPLKNTGVFLGLIGAGVAVALKEPLLSIFGRVAIFAGDMYTVGDRIEISQMKGDVIDVGFMYTRLMEIGNWIDGDMATGRTVQFANSKVFADAIFNYTSHFEYIWDEIHLPVTYASNLKAANEILIAVGAEYTREFLAGAEEQLQLMGQEFLVPRFQLDPVVYVKVTSNWVECSLRYIVNAKQRRAATNFIFRKVFERIQERRDIQIASQTMDLSVRQIAAEQPSEEEPPLQGGSQRSRRKPLSP